MTTNRNPGRRRDLTAPKTTMPKSAVPKSAATLHEHYVRAINSAVESGRDNDVHELAATYAADLREPSAQHAA